MKTLSTLALLFLATAAQANGVWEDDPPPDPPTVTPEPPRPTESWADRNSPKPMSRPLPCCIRDGQLVLTPFLFMSAERALRICERAKTTGAALIFECAGAVSPEAVK